MKTKLRKPIASAGWALLIAALSFGVVQPTNLIAKASQVKRKSPVPKPTEDSFAFRKPVALAAFNPAFNNILANKLVLDDLNVYWVYGTRNSWAVMKVNKSGGEPVQIFSSPNRLVAIALDEENIYLSIHPSRVLVKVNKKGGESITLAKLSGLCEEIFVDRTNLYYIDQRYDAAGQFEEAKLMKIGKDGSAPTKLTSFQVLSILGLTGDERHLYWANLEDETVNWVDKNGGPIKSFSTPQPGRIAVDEQSVYWTGNGVIRMDKSSGKITHLWTQGHDLSDRIAVDDLYIYFSVFRDDEDRTKDYFKMKKAGGNLIPMAAGEGVNDVALDSTSFYWLDTQRKALLKVGKNDPAEADPNVLRKTLAVVSIPADQEIYFDTEKVTPADLTKKVAPLAKLKLPQEQLVYLKVGNDVHYATVVSAMQAIEDANIQRVKIIVERKEFTPSSGMFTVKFPGKELMPPPPIIGGSGSPKSAKPLRTKPIQYPIDLLIVELKSGEGENQGVELNTKPFELSQLPSALKNILEQRPEKSVFLKASKSKRFADVLAAIRVLYHAGADPIGLQLVYLND